MLEHREARHVHVHSSSLTYFGNRDEGEVDPGGAVCDDILTGWIVATLFGCVGAMSFETDAFVTDFIHERLAWTFHVMSSNSWSTLAI